MTEAEHLPWFGVKLTYDLTVQGADGDAAMDVAEAEVRAGTGCRPLVTAWPLTAETEPDDDKEGT